MSAASAISRHPGDAAATLAVDRFLARLGTLSPAEWGRLDAEAQRAVGEPGLLGYWGTARHIAARIAGGPVPEPVLAAVALAGALAERLAPSQGGGRLVPRDRGDRGDRTPAHRALDARRRSLADLLVLQPGRPDPRTRMCLEHALDALWYRATLPPDAFARLYAPVAPVIPTMP